jgi:hypothetical protein
MPSSRKRPAKPAGQCLPINGQMVVVPFPVTQSAQLGCIPKFLPAHLHAESVANAIAHNPANRLPPLSRSILPPAHIALLTSKYWGSKGVDHGVAFLDTTNTTLKAKILAYANKWSKYGNIRYREASKANAQVRISLGSGGYWSYLGTDILSIPASEQTMNLEGFSLSTPDSEYDRVVCHEFGHSLGFPHEHERAEVIALLDVEKTVRWFADNVGWDRQTVMEQVFSPLSPSEIQATAADVRSIMCYQFAAACTRSGQPVPGGLTIDPTDGQFAGQIYPLVVNPPPPPPNPDGGGNGGGVTLAAETVNGGVRIRDTQVSFTVAFAKDATIGIGTCSGSRHS